MAAPSGGLEIISRCPMWKQVIADGEICVFLHMFVEGAALPGCTRQGYRLWGGLTAAGCIQGALTFELDLGLGAAKLLLSPRGPLDKHSGLVLKPLPAAASCSA